LTTLALSITPFDFMTSTDEQAYTLWEYFSLIRAERVPDDPPFPFADYLASNRTRSNIWRELVGLIYDPTGSAVIGQAIVDLNISGDHKDLAFINLSVLPEQRRQGHGRRLLRWAAETAQREGRSLLNFVTHARAPGGAAFAKALEARPAYEERVSQLVLAEVDRALMRQWQARAAERAVGFELGFWPGPYPEEDLAAIAELAQVMNTAPREQLQMDDESWTPEKLREQERTMYAGGAQRWTVYAREQASGNFAGFTEVYFRPSMPPLVFQGATAVYPRFRNLGLGRWLKAAMIERVLDEKPEARVVRTENAESNAPMLGINVEMGFKPYLASTVWQIPTEQALAASKA
jgi:mycothiol synthase